jgi:predicted DNA binding CopG/RHH family protein
MNDRLHPSESVDRKIDLQAAPQPITIRWNADQLGVVRSAAERYGMPYQTYVRDAAFRRALEDLQRLGVTPFDDSH